MITAARWLTLPCLVLMAGCASLAPTRELPTAAERSEVLSSWDAWGLTARLGIDDGSEGGSGRIDWKIAGADSALDFRGALGQGAWRLELGPELATLTRADGTVSSAADIDQLLWQETGWQVPVEALQWWVRGLPQPGAGRDLQLGPEGLPASLQQQGWQIVFLGYMDYAGQQLPRRLEAERGSFKLKLAVSRWWHLGPDDA